MKVTITKAAKCLGVSDKTLRRWEELGKIKSERTAGRHHRYDLVQLTNLLRQEFVKSQDTAVGKRRKQTST